MKVLTAEQMREVDRRTSELGIPSIVLMENAGDRMVEFLAKRYAPLETQRIVVICGKGNNGGDGLVVGRQLHSRIHPRALSVVMAGDPKEMRGDAAENFRMLQAVGCSVSHEITPEMTSASIVVDALLGTGIHGPAAGKTAELIRAINRDFPLASVVSVDLPSGLDSDSAVPPGEAAQILEVLAQAMQVAHQERVIHRDLKPANILLGSGVCEHPGEAEPGCSHTPLARRRLVLAVVASSSVGLVVDSIVFLWLAFGSLDFLFGQIIGKLWMVLLAIPFVSYRRRRAERLGLKPA